jgi:hypothetical protein
VSEGITSIPDLLRRFVAAPHSADVAVDNIAVTLQTNDPDLVSAILRAHADDESPCTTRLCMRLIRDDAAPSGGLYPTFLSSWPLGTLSLGPGTVIAIDCERCEIMGFIADSVPAERVVRELIPMLFDFFHNGGSRLQESVPKTAHDGSVASIDESKCETKTRRSAGAHGCNSQKSDISESEA